MDKPKAIVIDDNEIDGTPSPKAQEIKAALKEAGYEIEEDEAVILSAVKPDLIEELTPVPKVSVPKRIPWKRRYPKVCRNEPCGCGSGNKFKKCCLRK